MEGRVANVAKLNDGCLQRFSCYGFASCYHPTRFSFLNQDTFLDTNFYSIFSGLTTERLAMLRNVFIKTYH